MDDPRSRSPIAEVVGEYTRLWRHDDDHLRGICPTCSTASLNVTPGRGLWYCFTCQNGGDVISFAQKVMDLDLAQAVDFLNARAGLMDELRRLA